MINIWGKTLRGVGSLHIHATSSELPIQFICKLGYPKLAQRTPCDPPFEPSSGTKGPGLERRECHPGTFVSSIYPKPPLCHGPLGFIVLILYFKIIQLAGCLAGASTKMGDPQHPPVVHPSISLHLLKPPEQIKQNPVVIDSL